MFAKVGLRPDMLVEYSCFYNLQMLPSPCIISFHQPNICIIYGSQYAWTWSMDSLDFKFEIYHLDYAGISTLRID